MAIYRTTGALYAVAKETEFNVAPSFTDENVIPTTSNTSLTPEIDNIERKATTNSFIKLPSLAGKEYGSGTLGLELIPRGGSSKDILGADILEVALGVREEPGDGSGAYIGYSDAGTTQANKIYEVQSGETGQAVLYKLSKPCGTQPSLAVKMMLGCSDQDSQSLLFTGIVPNSVKFEFPVADIATVTFDIGASGFSTASGEPLLNPIQLTTNPYVGKNAKFTVDNKSYEAKDLSFTIENTVSDREAITSSGITSKAVTQKKVSGTLTVTFENWDELNKFKNNADAEIYLEMSVDGTHKFAIYIPKARYTSVGIEDDDGILVNKIEFEAYEDTNGEALYIAHQ